jgi:hypothetical protein
MTNTFGDYLYIMRCYVYSIEGSSCSLNDFSSHHSESFDGRGDHINAENWLNDMEELLATTGCTNEQKVLTLLIS